MGVQNYNEVSLGGVRNHPMHVGQSLGRRRLGNEGGAVLMGLIKYLIFTLGGARLEVLSTAKLIRFRTCRQCEVGWMSRAKGEYEGETAWQSSVPYAAKYFIKSLKIATATATVADNRRPTSTTTLTTSATTAGKTKKCSERRR